MCVHKQDVLTNLPVRSTLTLMSTQTIPCNDFPSLGDYVSHLRKARGYTLRDVVEAVDTAITSEVLAAPCSLSRGYLCSLEAGKYTHPSPHKLHALAYVYQVPPDVLLRKAGYIETAEQQPEPDTRQRQLLISIQEMTAEELDSLCEFVAFLKAKRTKRCQCQQ